MDLIQALGTVQSSATVVSYNGAQIAFNVIFAFILSCFVALVYQFTHRGYSYSKNFVTSLILISMVVTLIMMVIGNSLARAFALLGSFSIIRFRTAVKDTKDIAFVFLALVLGMASGTNNYIIGIIGVVIILFVVLLLDRFNLVGAEKTQYTLSIFVKGKKDNIDWDKVDDFLKSRRLLTISSRENGKLIEKIYAVDLRKEFSADELIKSLSHSPSVERVNLFSTKEELEY